MAVAVVASSTVRAHAGGHGLPGHGDAPATLLVALGLPTLAGCIGGVLGLRYSSRDGSTLTGRRSRAAFGLLFVGLGGAGLLSAPSVGHWSVVTGATVGVATALYVTHRPSRGGTDCRSHADLTIGAIGAHRLLEGLVLGALYAAGAVLALGGAVVLAGHAALETAAVGGLAAANRRPRTVVGAIVFLQVGYVAGAFVGLGIAGTVPRAIRTFVLATVGGILLTVGASETKRSIAPSRPGARGTAACGAQATWGLTDRDVGLERVLPAIVRGDAADTGGQGDERGSRS